MKTKIKRHSRSVLSVVLALCMLVSCMTVGIIATDAAKVTDGSAVGAQADSEYVGASLEANYTVYFTPSSAWTGNYTYYGSRFNQKGDDDLWSGSTAYDTGRTIGNNKVYKATVTTKYGYDSTYGGLGAIIFKAYTSRSNQQNDTSGHSTEIKPFGNKTWTSAQTFSGKYWDGDSWEDPAWDDASTTTSYYGLVGNVSNQYLASVNGSTTWTATDGWPNDTREGHTPQNNYQASVGISTPVTGEAGKFSITITTLDSATLTSNGHSNIEVGIISTANVQYGFRLGASSPYTYYNYYDAGGAADYTVPNTGVSASDCLYVQTMDSGSSGGSLKLSPGRTYTITVDQTQGSGNGSPNGLITITSVATAYKGHYALTGNVTDKYIVGSTLVKPTGVDENYWWSHYWDETAIDTPVPGESDKYYITFTTTSYSKDGYCANIGFAGTDNVQYAFIKNSTAYNTWGNDLAVDGSVNDSDDLYVYTKVSGGSLKLLPNTTYTITVDESQQQATGQPYGKITIDATTVYANAVNMVRPFDVTNRRPSDLEQSNAGGTLTVTSGSSTDSTSGDKTTATVTHAKPMTATYTASSANSGYTFAGWYSDEDCTTKVSDDLSYTPDAFSVTKTLYALYTENAPSTSYNVTVTKSGTGDGTISVTGAAVSNESGDTVTYSAYAGATVTVTAAPSTSPLSVLASITGSGATVSGNTATIENIAADKALTVTFTEKTSYTVTLKGTNGQIKAQAYQSDKTTTSGSEVTVASGSTGTIEVPIGGYLKLTAGDADSGKEFSNFKLETGKYKRTSDQSTGTSPMTIRPTDDMTAEAKFGTAGASSGWYVDFTHHSAPTTSNPNLKKYTGLKVKGFNNDSTKDVYYAKFTLKSGANEFHMWDGARDYKFTSDPQVVTFDNDYYPQAPDNGYQNATHPGKITVGADTEVYVYAMYNTQDKELKIRFTKTKAHGDSSTISTDGYQRIYAMDGTLGSTAGYGDTVITIGNGLLEKDIEDASGNSELYFDAHTNHNVYYFDPNQNISFRVQTTVDSAQTKLGVRGFVYNGKSVDAIDDGDGVYYADITVKAKSVLDINGGTTNNPILEVIPVYYNTTVPSNEFITFYVDANTMDNKFGYNIGYYIWYTTSQHEVDGNYPGQPLLRSGTKYVGYIPKHYVSNTGTYSDSTTAFSGVLLDNLHENSSVHDECLESWGCDKINYQTFDYEDPYVISQIQDVDTIEFVAKFEETNSNHQTGTHWYNSTYNKAELKGETSGYAFPSDISAPNSASQLNGFELLRNFDNKPVDVYGNELSTVNFADSVFIISVGNQDNGSANDWDTVWMIYQGGTGDHTLIKGDIPSSFINVADGSQLDTLKHKPVYISYEKFLDGSENAQTHSDGGKTGNSGDRIDGRWLYTKSTDETNGRIRVATLGKNNDTLSFLTYDEGASGARIAYYDNSVDGITQNGNSTKEDNYGRKTTFANRTTTAKAVLNEPIGYKIKGFYMLKTGVSGSDNGFSYSISDYDEMVRESATVAKYTNARDTWIVAVVEAVPASNLYIKHEMYGGPDAHSGAGTFYVKAEVLSSSGTVVATSGGFVDGDEGYEFDYLNSIATKGAGYKVKVTLRTVMAGTNTLYAWYPSDLATGDYLAPKTTNSANVDVFGKNGTQETIYWVDVDDLYADETYNFKYTNLAYYSDIDMGGAVNITHSLKDGSVGSGTTYASVRVLNGANVVATFNTDYSATGTITVPSQYTKRTSGNTIEITLRTVPDEYSTFNKFWESDGNTEITGASVDSTTRIATKTLPTIAVSTLYNNTGTEQNPKYEFNTSKSNYQYYSDLTKDDIRYEITYNYTSSLWGNQGYKVSGQFTVAELAYLNAERTGFATDNGKAEFLYSKAPYEDNFRQELKWNATAATVTKSENTLNISVSTTPTENNNIRLTFHVPFAATWKDKNGTTIVETESDNVTREEGTQFVPTTDADGKVWYTTTNPYSKSNIVLTYMTYPRYSINGEFETKDIAQEKYVQAPKSIWKTVDSTPTEVFFSYWALEDQNSGKVYAKNYSQNLNTAFYCDTVATAVYENATEEAFNSRVPKTKDVTASISLMEQSRNQWNSDLKGDNTKWSEADRLISDYLLAFSYNGKTLKKQSGMQFGVLYEAVGELEAKEGGGYYTNADHYTGWNTVTTDIENAAKSYINNPTTGNATYMRSQQGTAALDNKNQIQYTYTIKNGDTELRREYKYYRVYAYLIDSSGNITLSAPIFQTIYDIASIQNGSAEMKPVSN